MREQKPKTSSNFFKLPSELRQYILSNAFGARFIQINLLHCPVTALGERIYRPFEPRCSMVRHIQTITRDNCRIGLSYILIFNNFVCPRDTIPEAAGLDVSNHSRVLLPR